MASLVVEDGTRLDLDDLGAGDPPLVLVHGWCSHRGHWAAQIEHFAPSHRVIAVDRRGHGSSAVTPGGYLPAQHAADLAVLLDRLGVSDAVVVAHAGGGPTGMTLARDRPDLVAGLVLVDAIVRPAGPTGSGLAALVERLAGPDGAAVREGLYRSFFAAPDADPGRAAVAAAMQVPAEVAVAELGSLDLDTEAIARELRQPVLWVCVEPADRPRLERVFADVRIEELGGPGHFPQLESPDRVNPVIEAFVAALSP